MERGLWLHKARLTKGQPTRGLRLRRPRIPGQIMLTTEDMEASEVVSYVVMRLEDELYEQLLQGLRLT
jgi:hypothetical protein